MWKPIDTAPKDGTPIITDDGCVYWDSSRWLICVPNWRSGKADPIPYTCVDNGVFDVEPVCWMHHPHNPNVKQ